MFGYNVENDFLDACEQGNLDYVKKFTNTFVSYNIGVMCAIDKGQNHVAEWLLNNGADVNYLNGEFLRVARMYKNHSMIKMIELKMREYEIDPITGKANYKELVS